MDDVNIKQKALYLNQTSNDLMIAPQLTWHLLVIIVGTPTHLP